MVSALICSSLASTPFWAAGVIGSQFFLCILAVALNVSILDCSQLVPDLNSAIHGWRILQPVAMQSPEFQYVSLCFDWERREKEARENLVMGVGGILWCSTICTAKAEGIRVITATGRACRIHSPGSRQA